MILNSQIVIFKFVRALDVNDWQSCLSFLNNKFYQIFGGYFFTQNFGKTGFFLIIVNDAPELRDLVFIKCLDHLI
jgi:hypothetical protein